LDILDFLAVEEEYDFTREIVYLTGSLELIKIILNSKSNNKFIRILNFSDKS
jgi:hypothetical protein